MTATTKKIQLCVTCEEPTERCEDDAIYTEDGAGPLCLECWHKTPEYIQENVIQENSVISEQPAPQAEPEPEAAAAEIPTQTES